MDHPHYAGYNPSRPWCADGQGFMKLEGNLVEDFAGYAAIRSNGQLHVTDTVFNLNKRKIKANETVYALMPYALHKDPSETPFQNSSTPWPLLLGYNELHANITLTNHSWPLNYTVKAAGSCARVNLTSSSVFFKPKWVQPDPKTFFDVTELLSLEILQKIARSQSSNCVTQLPAGKSKIMINISDMVTEAVQKTIDAARDASAGNPKVKSLDGAPVAYFPAGCYALTKKIKITGSNYYVIGAGGLQTVSGQPPGRV